MGSPNLPRYPLARFDLAILLVPTIRVFHLLRSQGKDLPLVRMHQCRLDDLMLIPYLPLLRLLLDKTSSQIHSSTHHALHARLSSPDENPRFPETVQKASFSTRRNSNFSLYAYGDPWGATLCRCIQQVVFSHIKYGIYRTKSLDFFIQ